MTLPAQLTLILGVHRSGTSVLTQGLQALGAQVGVFDDTTDEDNPQGYSEHPEVRRFNDRLLANLGASWDNWGFRAGTIDWAAPAFALWLDEAGSILRGVFAGAGPFVLKDPRCATLAPFWERAIPQAGFALRRILILRDPAEVAQSQLQRVARRPQDFPVIADHEPMAALWAVTMAEVLAAVTDDETIVLSHESLMASPGNTLAAAATFAGLQPAEEKVQRFLSGQFKPELYRARVTEGDVAAGVWMLAARALFRDLLSAGSPRVLRRTEAVEILSRQSGLELLLRSLPAVKESVERLRVVSEDRRNRIDALNGLIWAMAPLVATASAEKLDVLIGRFLVVAEQTDFPQTNFAFGHTLGRLLLHAGRKAMAISWLDRIRDDFGHRAEFVELERKVRLLRGGDDEGAGD